MLIKQLESARQLKTTQEIKPPSPIFTKDNDTDSFIHLLQSLHCSLHGYINTVIEPATSSKLDSIECAHNDCGGLCFSRSWWEPAAVLLKRLFSREASAP